MDKRAFDDAFGPPKSLTDDQVRRLSSMQEAYLAAASAIMGTVPATPDRERALNLLRESKLASEDAIRHGRSILTREVLAGLFCPVEAEEKLVSAIWLNAYDFTDILKYCSDIFDPVTDRKTLQTGLYGRVWNTEIWVSRMIPVGMAKIIPSDWPPGWTPMGNSVPVSELTPIHG